MSHVMTQVTNTVTNSVTVFENYPFNSLASFQGKYLGASDAGLFVLDDANSVESIEATLTTGELHFGSEMQKRCSDFYIGMRSKGDITLIVTTDEDEQGTYVIQPLGVETLKQRRVKIGKGLKGKYWTFELVCSDDFDYDSMNIAAVQTSRRL